MQVRHIEDLQAQLDHIKKVEGEELLSPQQEKPWEEVVECLAVLAAIHMPPCNAAKERENPEKDLTKPEPKDGEPNEE